MTNQWIDNCIHNLMELKGRSIEKVFIVEMAFIEEGQDGKPVFEHPKCPFLQAYRLYLCFPSDEFVLIYVHQTDNWSLNSEPADNHHDSFVEKLESLYVHSIFRKREIIDFPKGQIISVTITQTEGADISEIKLVVGNQAVLLKSGEVYENNDGSLSVTATDESILVFLDPNDVNKVDFNKPLS